MQKKKSFAWKYLTMISRGFETQITKKAQITLKQ